MQWCLEDDHLTFRGVYVFTRIKHFGSVAIIRQPVSPTARWSNSPIVRQFDSPTVTCLFFNFTFQVRTAVVYRSRIALLTPMLNHFSLLNSVSVMRLSHLSQSIMTNSMSSVFLVDHRLLLGYSYPLVLLLFVQQCINTSCSIIRHVYLWCHDKYYLNWFRGMYALICVSRIFF
jgi:hypothetical protein